MLTPYENNIFSRIWEESRIFCNITENYFWFWKDAMAITPEEDREFYVPTVLSTCHADWLSILVIMRESHMKWQLWAYSLVLVDFSMSYGAQVQYRPIGRKTDSTARVLWIDLDHTSEWRSLLLYFRRRDLYHVTDRHSGLYACSQLSLCLVYGRVGALYKVGYEGGKSTNVKINVNGLIL